MGVREKDGIEPGQIRQRNSGRADPAKEFAKCRIEIRVGQYSPLAELN
jgi:hypothetical protein